MDLTALYCSLDDFWKFFKQEWNKHLIDNAKVRQGEILAFQLTPGNVADVSVAEALP